MEIWDKLRTPPPNALKSIQAGRLKGKSDINPQWRYEQLTQVFGVCGFGWRYEIAHLWSEPGAAGQIMAFARINLYIKHNGEWSEAIPAVGGSMAVEQEFKGLHTSDECYKMAVTDAIGTAAKMIGLAADVYRGTYDGSKYQQQPAQPEQPEPEQPKPETVIVQATIDMLAAQLTKCAAACEAHGKSELLVKCHEYQSLVAGNVLSKDEVKEISSFLHEAAAILKGGAK